MKIKRTRYCIVSNDDKRVMCVAYGSSMERILNLDEIGEAPIKIYSSKSRADERCMRLNNAYPKMFKVIEVTETIEEVQQ